MKLLFRVVLLAACAAVVAVLAGDTLAAPSVFRPVLNRNRSLAIVEGLDGADVMLTHVDGSHRESFRGGESPSWSPNGKRLAYVDGADIRVVNADGKNDTLVTTGQDPSWTPNGDLLISKDGDIVRIPGANGSPVNLTNTAGVDETQPAASPDGMWIAFTSNQDVNDPSTPLAQTDYNLWIMNTTDLIASQNLLWESNSGGQYRGFPSWAPDSHRLAFADNNDIWTTPPIANNQTNLTNDAMGQGYPAWSPDGKLVAYAETSTSVDPDGSKPSTIWTIDVDSSARKQLTTDPAKQDTMPDWQTWPVENGRIAFGFGGLDGSIIGAMTAAGEHPASLFPFIRSSDGQIQDIQYAPNGHQIAILGSGSMQTDPQTIGVISDVGILDLGWISQTTVDVGSMSWFPDEDHMVWASRAAEADLFDVRAGETPVNLTNTPTVREFSPAVSLDGERIAFLSDQQPFSDPPVAGTAIGLWTMDFDGLDRQFLTVVVSPGQFAFFSGHVVSWSPSGDQIAYSSDGDVWTIGSDPNKPTNPTNQTDDSLFQIDVSWAPDGGLIAFDQFTLFGGGSQIWTIDPISGVRNRVSPEQGDNSFLRPSWQPLWAPGSDRYYVWGDNRCDGKVDLLDVLDTLKVMAGSEVKHIPGCPWSGESGVNSTNKTAPWGSTTCNSQLTSADILNSFEYLLDLNGFGPPDVNSQGGLNIECPPMGSYTEFIAVS